jgi:hypothetical protein
MPLDPNAGSAETDDAKPARKIPWWLWFLLFLVPLHPWWFGLIVLAIFWLVIFLLLVVFNFTISN